jgi:hypothetical protein
MALVSSIEDLLQLFVVFFMYQRLCEALSYICSCIGRQSEKMVKETTAKTPEEENQMDVDDVVHPAPAAEDSVQEVRENGYLGLMIVPI